MMQVASLNFWAHSLNVDPAMLAAQCFLKIDIKLLPRFLHLGAWGCWGLCTSVVMLRQPLSSIICHDSPPNESTPETVGL